MPDIPGTIEYLTLILQAIADNRKTAKELLDMTPEQRDAFVVRLKAEERSEIDRGHGLQDATAPE